MWNKVEFSDLYKFLTSVGLIFIASAFLIPWLFMKQDIGIVSFSDYNQLIDISKELTNRRIELNLGIVKLIPYIFGLLFPIGLLLTTIGICNWRRKQRKIDELDEIELEIQRRKIRPLNEKEISQKAKAEVEEEIDVSGGEVKKTEKKIEEFKDKLISVEKKIQDKILAYNSFIYEPKFNVKIAEKIEVDILLKAYNRKKYPDILIEVKYIQTKLNIDIINTATLQITNSKRMLTPRNHSVHSTLSSIPIKMILIFVYRNEIASPDEIGRFKKGVSILFESNKRMEYYILSDKELNTFDIKKIME